MMYDGRQVGNLSSKDSFFIHIEDDISVAVAYRASVRMCRDFSIIILVVWKRFTFVPEIKRNILEKS